MEIHVFYKTATVCKLNYDPPCFAFSHNKLQITMRRSYTTQSNLQYYLQKLEFTRRPWRQQQLPQRGEGWQLDEKHRPEKQRWIPATVGGCQQSASDWTDLKYLTHCVHHISVSALHVTGALSPADLHSNFSLFIQKENPIQCWECKLFDFFLHCNTKTKHSYRRQLI